LPDISLSLLHRLKRAFYILFAVYFLSLVMMPCGDEATSHATAQTQVSQSLCAEAHAHDICTPFCICSCCSTNIVVKDFQPLPEQPAIKRPAYSPQPSSDICSAIIPIWQPPKLA